MIFLLLIPALIIVYLYYRKTVPDLPQKRRTLLSALRFTVILILLLLLFNPIISFRRTVSFQPQVLFLFDNSYSMDNQAGGRTKKELFAEYREELKGIAETANYEVQEFGFAEGIDDEGISANLTETLQDLSQRVNLDDVHQIYLLSDGWFNDSQFDIVNRFNVPVNTVHPDIETEEFDLSINRLIYNQTAYTDEEITIIADLLAENFDEKAQVTLYLDDRKLDEKEIDFSERAVQQADFSHLFDEPGFYTIRAEIDSGREEGELSTDNNIYPGAIRVIEEQSGSYIITDKPGWDVMFISSNFNLDERKDSKVFNHRNGRFLLADEPVDDDRVFADHLQLLVIINRGEISFSQSQINLLTRFVSNGGGLWLIGKTVPELQEILPAADSGIDRLFRSTIAVTSQSSQYRSFRDFDGSKIPPVNYYYVDSLVHSQVLARFNNDEKSPAIIFSEYDRGRVLYMPFFNLWRWQMRVSDSGYNPFISSIASWIANPAGMDFFAQTDKSSYFLGETVNVTLTATDETLNPDPDLNPRIILYDEDEEKVSESFMSYRDGYYRTQLSRLEPGKYSFEISEETTNKQTQGDFVVSEIHADSRHRGFNSPLLRFVSNQTGGQSLVDDNIGQAQLSPAEAGSRSLRIDIPLYRHWLIITLFLGAFCLELYLRKKWGLI